MTSKRHVASVIALAAIMIVAGIAIGASVSPVVAQDDDDDDDEIPELPAVYHGELTVADGTLTGPVLIEAVADGEVQDTIIAEADGSIGGPTISDDKLEVQSPDDDAVEFHIGGEPVSITSLDGESVGADSIPFNNGDQEIELEATEADLESDLGVTITDTNDPIAGGEDLTVDIEVTGDGPSTASEDIELRTPNDAVVDSTTVTLDVTETTTETLTWTDTDVAGEDVSITVAGATSSDSTTVTIESPDIIAEPQPGGVSPQPPADDDDTETSTLPDGAIHSEAQLIVSSDDFGLSQVRFTEEAGVASITWDTDAIPEEPVTVQTYDETPDGVDPIPGAMVTLAEVLVPEDVTDEPATVELRADREQLAAVDADADDLRVVRFSDGEWESLETTISEETETAVIVEAETPGFSFVGVQATSEPTAEIDAPAEVQHNETVTLSGANSTTEYGEITDYEWTINGISATGETVDETFTDLGTVTVELTVTNDAGETDTTTTELTVAELEPDALGGLLRLGALVIALVGLIGAGVFVYRRR